MAKKTQKAVEEKPEAPVVEAPVKEEKVEQPKMANGLKRIKVNLDELAKLEKEGKLVGYDRKTSEAIIR